MLVWYRIELTGCARSSAGDGENWWFLFPPSTSMLTTSHNAWIVTVGAVHAIQFGFDFLIKNP